jgi:hypothetical protein
MLARTHARACPTARVALIPVMGFALWSCGGSGARQKDAAQTDVGPAITEQADSAWTQVAQDWDSFCVQAGTLMAKRMSECTLAQPTASTVRQPLCDSTPSHAWTTCSPCRATMSWPTWQPRIFFPCCARRFCKASSNSMTRAPRMKTAPTRPIGSVSWLGPALALASRGRALASHAAMAGVRPD